MVGAALCLLVVGAEKLTYAAGLDELQTRKGWASIEFLPVTKFA